MHLKRPNLPPSHHIFRTPKQTPPITDTFWTFTILSVCGAEQEGGVLRCPVPPFCELFQANNLQQVAKTMWQSGEYPHFDTVWPPTLKKPGYAPVFYMGIVISDFPRSIPPGTIYHFPIDLLFSPVLSLSLLNLIRGVLIEINKQTG